MNNENRSSHIQRMGLLPFLKFIRLSGAKTMKNCTRSNTVSAQKNTYSYTFIPLKTEETENINDPSLPCDIIYFCIYIYIFPKINQPWIFIERTSAEAEAPILWSPDAKRQLIGKDPDAEKDRGQEEEEEMVGRHHWLKGREFEQAPGDGERQGSLACWSSWGCKE